MRLPWRGIAPGAAIVLALAGAAHAAGPFGIATPDSGGPAFGGPLGPLFVWISLRQQEFYHSLTAALSDIKANGWAVWLLLGVSFAYGVFHAAGPGHGKAVISAYLVSSGETVTRGIALSFMSAFAQALTAVLLVGIAAAIFRVTAVTMTRATDWFEILSYGLIAIVGAWLLWSKTFGGRHDHRHHRVVEEPNDYGHDHHDHDHHHHHNGDHDHAHHDHAPPARQSVFARGWSAIMAVGIRPCSGAIIVLVFALSQGLFLVGIAATFVMAIGTGLTVAALATLAVSARGLAVRLAGADSSMTARLVHAAEIAAATGVMIFGLLLLAGSLVNGLPG